MRFFSGSRNKCGSRVREGRALQVPPITQQELVHRLVEMGMKISVQALSKIENGTRRVTTVELIMLGKALNVSLDWLCKRSSKPWINR